MKIKEVGNSVPYRIRFKHDVVVSGWGSKNHDRNVSVLYKKDQVIESAQGAWSYAVNDKGTLIEKFDIKTQANEAAKIIHIMHVYDKKYCGYMYLDSKDVDILPLDRGHVYKAFIRDGYDPAKDFEYFYTHEYLPTYEESMRMQHPNRFNEDGTCESESN